MKLKLIFLQLLSAQTTDSLSINYSGVPSVQMLLLQISHLLEILF
jgi:hypothetical protein